MAKSQKLTRVRISRPSERGRSKMNILVDADPRLKVGSVVTLKDSENPEAKWIIDKIHETFDRADINYGWNNNI